jgi:peptide deformylase
MHTILPEEENPALRNVSKALTAAEIKSARIKKLIEEMKKLLSKEEFGVALAAVQLGEPVRLFIVSGRALARGGRNAKDEPAGQDKPPQQERVPLPDQVYINPQLLKLSREKKDKHEGCLSVRGKWGEVPRSEKATIKALDEHGRAFTRGASGFLAHIYQHEMDHLEGILYTDKAVKLYDEQEKESD